jgi:hypothetical protein
MVGRKKMRWCEQRGLISLDEEDRVGLVKKALNIDLLHLVLQHMTFFNT